MFSAWHHVALVLLVLGGLLLGLRWAQRSFTLHPEVTRKAVHLSMGLLTLSFPWLFDAPLPVWVLGGVAIAILLALRIYKPLANDLGRVLGSVERRSLGEIYFPLSIMLLFSLAEGDALLFCIPILVLTLADAVAALIGMQYGQHRYVATQGQKSAEGSVMFFMTAFFSVHVPLLLFGGTGRAETLLVALIVGLLVMLLEAIAWQGLDNLFIPLGTFLLLKTHLEMDVHILITRFIVTFILVVFVLFWRRRTTLTDSALLGAVLIGYLSWLLGNWQWLLAPLTLFVSYPFLIYRVDAEKTPLTPLERQVMVWLSSGTEETEDPRRLQRWRRVHNVYAVLSVSAGGMLWLFCYRTFNLSSLFYPYTLSFAINLVVICIASLSPVDYWSWRHLRWVCLYVVQGWLLFFGPLLLLELSEQTLGMSVWGWLGISLGAIAYYLVQPQLRQSPREIGPWIWRALLTTAASTVPLLSLLR